MTHYYPGFDTYTYPGDEWMAWIMRNSNAHVCCPYLVAPSHPNASWTGKRAVLAAQGWGFAPIFVGQQQTGPGAHVLTGDQGATDAALAAERMAAEGFPPGSYCYLDMENGPPDAAAMDNYVSAWAMALAGAGWGVGIYCSHLLAEHVADLAPGARIWCFRLAIGAPVLRGPALGALEPAQCGYGPAVGWQHAQGIAWHPQSPVHSVVTVDLSSWALPDPSAPDETAPVA